MYIAPGHASSRDRIHLISRANRAFIVSNRRDKRQKGKHDEQTRQDMEAGKVNCIVVYKIDRLSRSVLDFTRLVDLFERHGVWANIYARIHRFGATLS